MSYTALPKQGFLDRQHARCYKNNEHVVQKECIVFSTPYFSTTPSAAQENLRADGQNH